MDERLKEVQTTDLTDSRVNRDFVDWLKTKGMNYLLLALLALCAFFAWEWYQQQSVLARDQAWADLTNATSPATPERPEGSIRASISRTLFLG